MAEVLRLVRGEFRVHRGTEGPRHDPYSYTEVVFYPTDPEKAGFEFCSIRMGLGVEFRKDGSRQKGYDEDLDVLQFEVYAGICPWDVERLIRKRDENRWRKMTRQEREDWMEWEAAEAYLRQCMN